MKNVVGGGGGGMCSSRPPVPVYVTPTGVTRGDPHSGGGPTTTNRGQARL